MSYGGAGNDEADKFKGEHLKLWEFRPVARSDDPHWKEYEYQGSLIVKAGTAAEARLIATKWYKASFAPGTDYTPHQFYRSAFSDEKLYQVVEISDAGGREVIEDIWCPVAYTK